MSRIINSIEDPVVGVVITTRYEDGSSTQKSYLPGDIVTDFRYRENGEAKLITGRVKKINYTYKNINRSYSNSSTSYFAKNCSIDSIVIDASEHYESNLVLIPIGEVLESLDIDKTVISVKNAPFLVLKTNIYLSDNTTTDTEIRVGTDIQNMEYEPDVYTRRYVSGRIIDIVCTYSDKLYADKIVILNTNNAIIMIDNNSIISLGEEIVTLSEADSITDAIANVNNTNCISLGAGTFEEELTITGEIYIRGNRAGVRANTGARKNSNITADETVFTKPISFKEGAKVILDGIIFTKDALFTIDGAEEVTFRNCKFIGIIPNKIKSFLLLSNNPSPCKINALYSYFGNVETTEDGYNMYNLFELACKCANNTTFRSNYYEAKCCANNIICVYDTEEEANIIINNNAFEFSGNAVRIGVKGEPICTFNIHNNSYDSTLEDNNGEYAGLVLFQPYGAATVSMKNVTVYISNTSKEDNYQLFYLYAAGKDTPFTDENKPTVYVDGLKWSI